MPAHWDADQYLRYADLRGRPFADLLARVPDLPPAPTVLDLGCGPGNSTAALRRRWPDARLLGLDTSPDLLAEARGAHGEPTAEYREQDVAAYDPAPERPDLIASNAALHWMDTDTADHLELLPRWAAALRPGGVIAFQLPGNFAAPSHTLLADLRRTPRWRDRLATARPDASCHAPDRYARTLLAAGCTADVWESTYTMVLPGPDPVLEWVKGSTLRPVLDLLPEAGERAEFLAEYGALLREAYPATWHGTLFPFRRVFAVAVKR
ncbi:methyltransferase domain-containing protein [Kitasatospora sp. YST-16]|uniref:methyltransferase domain-containing protein n=1 Tax=Kitasatospora sp. YST-16 TaxID=2998080 RepID=UPI002284C7F4|nr:methyltransferase domain-containing protein [Kitasatospora sp. YST-16]WAL73518.1 methyltransferase domain-containing protein [Kitasatospora sp. YST-16]WNW39574.1 methyltransferase domain-containing protein [Streptomyces sp. Li-HN-5-13]